jgi:hypothetical protein
MPRKNQKPVCEGLLSGDLVRPPVEGLLLIISLVNPAAAYARDFIA